MYAAAPADVVLVEEQQATTDEQQRHIEAMVAEIAARAGIDPPAVLLTHSLPKSSGAGIFERRLEINPGSTALSRSKRVGH